MCYGSLSYYPQTTIVETYDKFVADGRVYTEYVPNDPRIQHSACIGVLLQVHVLKPQPALRSGLHVGELHIASGIALSHRHG